MAAKKHQTETKLTEYTYQVIKAKTRVAKENNLKIIRLETAPEPTVTKIYR